MKKETKSFLIGFVSGASGTVGTYFGVKLGKKISKKIKEKKAAKAVTQSTPVTATN